MHLVHGLPATHLDQALRIARWQGAGTVCVTDRTDRDGADPWAGLASYWHEAVTKGVRAATAQHVTVERLGPRTGCLGMKTGVAVLQGQRRRAPARLRNV